jgi:heme/copper-type cytochrome/quinol oxidase subunit 2
LTANINNTLIDEIKSSYLLSDPISYSTEASREFFYSSLPFFKFLIFKSLVADLLTTTKNLPFNFSAVNEYLFFYALNTNSLKVGLTDTLYKDQHRPLKKSITNMLRLHGTGAIAMPVDVRLQILASSRDVIHS